MVSDSGSKGVFRGFWRHFRILQGIFGGFQRRYGGVSKGFGVSEWSALHEVRGDMRRIPVAFQEVPEHFRRISDALRRQLSGGWESLMCVSPLGFKGNFGGI